MPNDPSQDKDFLAATPQEQHAYLMQTDQGYAKAKPDEQQAYLSHVRGESQQPLGPATSIGPENRGMLQRLNDWWVRPSAAYSGTLANPGRSPRQVAGQVGKQVAVASLPFLGAGLATAPLATGLGLAGGTAGALGGGYLGEKAGEYANAPELGEDVGGLAGGVLGGGLGASRSSALRNKAASVLRSPATARQSQLGRPGSVKDILPPQMQRWTLPPWMVPKGEVGTPTNPGQFNEIPSKLPKTLRGDPFSPEQMTGGGAGGEGTGGNISQLPEPVQMFPNENPGYMASIPRKKLVGMASTGKLGAGEQLQQLGQKVLYSPRGAIAGKKIKLPWEPEENE